MITYLEFFLVKDSCLPCSYSSFVAIASVGLYFGFGQFEIYNCFRIHSLVKEDAAFVYCDSG